MHTDEITAAFQRDGVVVVRNLFTVEEVAELEDHVAAFIRDVVPTLDVGDVFYEDGGTDAIKSLFRMHHHDPFFVALRQDDRLTSFVRAVFPGDVVGGDVGFFGKAARDGSVTPPHQDNGFSYWEPPHCLKASIALDVHSEDNGAMYCQRGSHTLGLLPHQASGVLGFSQGLRDLVDREAYPVMFCDMRPGDVAFHHTNTVHGSGANTTDRARRMVSIVYRSSLATENPEGLAAVNAERERLYRAKLR